MTSASSAATSRHSHRWRHRLAELAVAAGPLAVGAVSGLLTAAAIPTWYRTLDKPAWNPPDWIFGPVWTTLYLLMGVAVLLVWRRNRSDPRVRVALAAFAVQLSLNFGWSLIFFGRRDVGLALAEIVVLHAAIVGTIVTFGRVRRPAALLLIPYLAWVSFATILNAEIWRLNG